jgi:hypothetical protein
MHYRVELNQIRVKSYERVVEADNPEDAKRKALENFRKSPFSWETTRDQEQDTYVTDVHPSASGTTAEF